MTYFNHSKPKNYGIKNILFVHNPVLSKSFEAQLEQTEMGAKNFSASWKDEEPKQAIQMDLYFFTGSQDWRRGRIPFLEKIICGSLNRISFAMECFRDWTSQRNLSTKAHRYQRKTIRRQSLNSFCEYGTIYPRCTPIR